MDGAVERARGRVVVGFDGSEPSLAALRWAVDECRAKNEPLTIVSCWHLPAQPATAYEPMMSPDLFEGDAQATVAEAVKEVGETGHGLDIQTEVLMGLPSRCLLDLAEGARLVIVGSRGRGGVAGLFLGSVSQHLAEHAPCPVVIVHAPE